MPKHTGRNSVGGTRPAARRDHDTPISSAACYAPSEADAALLRGVWAKRAHLKPREAAFIEEMLRRIRGRAMTAGQLGWARDIGKSLGVGYDDPAMSVPTNAGPGVVRVERWGALPAKPPGK